MQDVKGARVTVYFTLPSGEFTTAQSRDESGPEALRRQVGVYMENLPLPGDPSQEGGDDKLGDTLATPASGEEEIADVVFGVGEVGLVVDDDETGEFVVDVDQEGLGGGVAPVAFFELVGEEAVVGEF